MRRAFTLLLLLSGATMLCGQQIDPASPRAQFDALVSEYEELGGARQFAPRFLEFADAHAEDPSAVDALLWVAKNLRNRHRPESGPISESVGCFQRSDRHAAHPAQ